MGPELGLLYNDAYAEILGAKTAALGRRFAHIWPEIGRTSRPLVVQPWPGKPITGEFALTVNRHGHDENVWFLLLLARGGRRWRRNRHVLRRDREDRVCRGRGAGKLC